MGRYETVKRQHERAVIEEFVAFINHTYSSTYSILSMPDPPDAVLQEENKHLWLEVADIYRSDDEAKEEMSFATTSEDEEKFIHRGPIFNPNAIIADKSLAIINQKLSKSSYSSAFSQFGKGLLVLDARDPLFSQGTLDSVIARLQGVAVDNDKKYFSGVYLAYRLPDKFYRSFSLIYASSL